MNLRLNWRLIGLTVFSSIFSLIVFSGSIRAQGLGSIVGAVTDQAGAVSQNGKVTGTEVGTGFSRTATTDSEGRYVLASLRPAQYDIAVEATGFTTFAQKGITLLANQTLTVKGTAQVSGTTEQLNVTAGDVQVDTSTPTLKQVIEKERVQELPLNGRNAATLTLLVPGAVAAPSGGADQGTTKTFPGAVTIAPNGARQKMINYSLHGATYVTNYTTANRPFPLPDAP